MNFNKNEQQSPALQPANFVVFYEDFDCSIPMDRELTVLQYIAVRFIEKKEIPTLVIHPSGEILSEPFTEGTMRELVAWYYETHPQHRRESKRAGLLEEMERSIPNFLSA